MSKKNLFIFYGEYRTFEKIVNKLKNLDKFDVIFSTWDYCTTNGDITKSKIQNVCSFCNPIISSHLHFNSLLSMMNGEFLKTKGDVSVNTTRMLYHMKVALNSVDSNEYDSVILHRCDALSNITELDFSLIENDTLYIDPGEITETSFWVNDYCFVGKIKTMKSYIDSIPFILYNTPHFCWGEPILKYNLKYNWYHTLFKNKNDFEFNLVR